MPPEPQAAVPTLDLPARSQRVGSAKTSPVRDLLALTQRPEVISFAGGLPHPSCSTSKGSGARSMRR
ncbi:hypothetical protein [Microbacterium sp. Se63.02b]|uniref:hypothetical protein n=1 Tax=Microbacterium sp. Se63.02b TaxID=2709304 RepID=UPI001921C3AC|nr:hypothetical protein [Microbacterium sp. Se63.02b]